MSKTRPSGRRFNSSCVNCELTSWIDLFLPTVTEPRWFATELLHRARVLMEISFRSMPLGRAASRAARNVRTCLSHTDILDFELIELNCLSMTLATVLCAFCLAFRRCSNTQHSCRCAKVSGPWPHKHVPLPEFRHLDMLDCTG